MSERKVLTKYFPPDFDPRALTRKRGPKSTGVKTQAVRIMAPFSMKCTTCGEYIYKGRKFNSRKETPQGERYLGIQIFFFSIRCTRCSAEIIFRTDPKINDYTMVKGAVRNMEPWRNRAGEDEGVEERLDRLEREEAEAAGEEEKNAMEDLEAKNADARREMAAADALDEIRQRNARIQRSEKEGVDFADYVVRPEDEERARQEREDDEAARRAFAAAKERSMLDLLGEEVMEDVEEDDEEPHPLSRATAGPSSSSSSSSGAAPSASSSSSSSSTTPIAGHGTAIAGETAVGAAADVTAMPPPPPSAPFKRPPKKKKVDYAAKLGIKKKAPLV